MCAGWWMGCSPTVTEPPLAVEPGQETFSANGRFSVQVTEIADSELRLAVFQRDGTSSRLHWSNTLASKEDPDNWPGDIDGFRRWVANDGSVAILWDTHWINRSARVLLAFHRNGREANFSLNQIRNRLGVKSPEDTSPGETFGEKQLEVFLEDESPPKYAIWDAEAQSWGVLDLATLTLSVAKPEERARLDSIGVAKARGLVRGGVSGWIVPGMNQTMVAGATNGGLNFPMLVAQEGVAYRYLTARRLPEDKPLIYALLKNPSGSATWSSEGGGLLGPAIKTGFVSPDLALGDELVAAWEGLASTNADSSTLGGAFGSRPPKPLHYLGGVAGNVLLPFEFPNGAGPLRVFLIPDHLEKNAWLNDREVSDISFFTAAHYYDWKDSERPDHAEFYFDAMPPGKYRLKAVWDRRSDKAASGLAGKTPPGPGDYESAELEPIQIEAGKRMIGIALVCTNRVGEAEAWYAEDAAWAAKHPTASTDEPDEEELDEEVSSPAGQQAKILFEAPAADWVIKSEMNPGKISLERIRLVEGLKPLEMENARRLEVKFATPGFKADDDTFYQAELIDEHGCRASPARMRSSSEINEMDFELIPFGSRTFRLEITSLETVGNSAQPKTRVEARFSLTNLIKTAPEQWKADRLPAKRELDLVTVELKALQPPITESWSQPPEDFEAAIPAEAAAASRATLAFTKDGQPAPGWRKEQGWFTDRWGNRSSDPGQFCKKETLFKYSMRLRRDPDQAEFSVSEKWAIPLERVPGSGESMPLGLTNAVEGVTLTLFNIGGPGEFSYRRGRLLSAESEIRPRPRVPFIKYDPFPAPPPPEPKLFVRQGDTAKWMIPFGFTQPDYRKRLNLSATIPHLACLIEYNSVDASVELLERNRREPEPMGPPARDMYGRHATRFDYEKPRSPYKFLPLNVQPGETNKQLTFIVQRIQVAEFFVEIPPSARNGPP